MDAPVSYIPELIEPDRATDMFAELANELEWERREGAPRSEYYSNDTPAPYAYGAGVGRRTYLPQPWHPAMLEVRALLEARLGYELTVVFNNLYTGPRDFLGWHADDDPTMDPHAPIVTVSLGSAREIQFRHDAASKDIQTLLLEPGSAAVMAPGMQQSGWKHRIPKVGRVVGPRISMTYRHYVDPSAS